MAKPAKNVTIGSQLQQLSFLTYNKPYYETYPCVYVKLHHQVDVNDNAGTWNKRHQWNLEGYLRFSSRLPGNYSQIDEDDQD